jgi:hypothetical protein
LINIVVLEQNQHFSPDLFLYVRCAVVAHGQEVFEGILSNASKMLKDTEFEILLSLSSAALKKAKEFEYIVDVVTRHFQIKKIVHILFKK